MTKSDSDRPAVDEQVAKMRETWNGAAAKSKFGFISHLQKDAEWDLAEFALVGERFVNHMAERFLDYGDRPLQESRLVEIGCGVGRFLKPLSARFAQVHGVDISQQSSKHVDSLRDVALDYVVTVCGHANETCPHFPGRTRVVHVGFDDPPRLAEGAKTDEEAMPHYRRVRDEIKAWVETLPRSLPTKG